VEFSNTSLHANTYVWAFDDPDQKTSTQSSPSFIYSAGGSYSVQLVATDLINCSDTTTQLIEVLEPAVLNLPYPNPGIGAFTVEWRTNENVPASLSLVDATGREVRSMEVISEAGINRLTLDITGQPSGLYILRITYSNTVKSYRLIVIQ
jgi:PKD repeat protein